jgi:heterodisulfide reductase subunit B
LRHLGVECDELDDWNCCGATAYMSVDEGKACVLAARNLALVQKSGRQQVLAPCSACYLVLNKAQHYIQDYPAIKDTVDRALATANLRFSGQIPVRHPLDILLHDVGFEAIKAKVTRPLKGLKVAPYYGCQIVRPYASFDDPATPTTMDRLLETLGATVVRYPLKTKCCGGSLTGTVPEAGLRLAYILLREAQKRSANVIATVCPLCQFNLDAYHGQMEAQWEPARMPTVYFTQLMGLAFGLPEPDLALNRSAVALTWRPAQAATAR